MSFLDEIIANKRKDVEQQKAVRFISDFEKEPRFHREPKSLVSSLQRSETGIIAEFKRKSPSKGWFKPGEYLIEQLATTYEQEGAAGISVLTDKEFFGGSMNDLCRAGEVVNIPLLRKDFILDQWQVAESKQSGADVILLIAACLSPREVKELTEYAKGIGLEVLLEIHNEEELGHICGEVDLVGVNNRDLETFEVNIETSFKLIEKIKGKPAVAESGINTPRNIIALRQAGFKGFLIGERFMREPDPGMAFKNFVAGLQPY